MLCNVNVPKNMYIYCYRRKADEVQVLEDTIRARNEQHKKAGIELDATCHICLKTKFADGVGHICNYCSIRCCARCGGKVTLRSNKVSLIKRLSYNRVYIIVCRNSDILSSFLLRIGICNICMYIHIHISVYRLSVDEVRKLEIAIRWCSNCKSCLPVLLGRYFMQKT